MYSRDLNRGEAAEMLKVAGIEIVNEDASDGNEIRCRCPQHEDASGHLYVNAYSGAALCHKCQMATHVRKLCGRISGMGRIERPGSAVLDATARYYEGRMTGTVWTYLTEERGLTEEVVRQFRVGWANGTLADHLQRVEGFSVDECVSAGVLRRTQGGVVDYFNDRIVFPNVIGGRVVHMSGRILDTGGPKWLHLRGVIELPYNADALRREGCVWVEGPLDVLSLAVWGYPAAAGMGTQFKRSWRDTTSADGRVYVCLDGDQAGRSGALAIADAIGLGARVVNLPEAEDPNDMLKRDAHVEFEECLAAASDPLVHRINQVPVNLPPVERPDALAEILELLSKADPVKVEPYLELIGDRFRLGKPELASYRSKIKKRRREREGADDHEGTDRLEVRYGALFEGLVDLVLHDGEPAYLVADGDELRITDRVVRDGTAYVLPSSEKIPWSLPPGEEVLQHLDEDDAQLYDDLVAYYESISELPTPEHYHLLATWTLHSYILEKFQYSPVICLFAVPERGKTRTGKAMVYVSYRGIHVESLRDSYIIRFASAFGGTIFFDVMKLWKKAEREGSEDVLLGRYERGFRVPRVNRPDKGPMDDTDYYTIFGATVIGTNEEVHKILDTRALTITMPQATRSFEDDVIEESSLTLRARLIAFRARHLDTALPEAEKVVSGRLGDITRPLLQVVRLVKPDAEPELLRLIGSFRGERLAEKASTLEAGILIAMDSLRGEVSEGTLAVGLITLAVNEERLAGKEITPQRIGKTLRSLDFAKGRRTSSGATILWDNEKLARTMETYGLTETTETTDSAPSSVEVRVECAESAVVDVAPALPGATHGFVCEVADWEQECAEFYDEQRGLFAESDGIEEQKAREFAVERVLAVFGGEVEEGGDDDNQDT